MKGGYRWVRERIGPVQIAQNVLGFMDLLRGRTQGQFAKKSGT